MSQLYVDNIRNRTGGPIGIPTGAVVTGVVTATTGNITGNQTVGGNLTVTGNAEVGGVLTYEDVTNVDSVGIVTAQSGIRVTGGVIEAQAGQNKIPSLYSLFSDLPSASTYHGMFAHVHEHGKGYFAHAGGWYELVNKELSGVVGTGTESYNIGSLTASGRLTESVNIVANKLSAVPNVNLDNGMVHYYTTNETTTANPNIISTAGINTNMTTGDTMSVTILSKPNSAGYFPRISIDGLLTGITTYWNGGSAPSSAESSGVDANTYQIIKTGNETFDVLANTSNFA